MKTKKTFYWICGVLMILALGLRVADNLMAGRNPDTYEITVWIILDIFVARPVFYTCLGGLSGVILMGPAKSEKLRKIFFIVSVVILSIMAVIAAAELLGHPVTLAPLQLIRQLFQFNSFFLIPGFLLGCSLELS